MGSPLGTRATLSASHCHPVAYFLNSAWDPVPWMGGPTLREAKSPAQGHGQMGRVGIWVRPPHSGSAPPWVSHTPGSISVGFKNRGEIHVIK